MTFAEEVEAAKAQTHWTAKQRNHLRRLMRRAEKSGDVHFAVWLSDAHGRPANHGIDSLADRREWTARPGMVQIVKGPLQECSGNALHATLHPHRWQGVRAWMVAMVGEVMHSDIKIAALRREIIGEILPEEALTPQLGVRLGRRDLAGANLARANLARADLAHANLAGANLARADLARADLAHANLARAFLAHANFAGANIAGANIADANLAGAFLAGADLARADLAHAFLARAFLAGAYIGFGATAPDGWRNVNGYIERAAQ